MCVSGASGTGKTQLILSMLTIEPQTKTEISMRTYTTFQPEFDAVIFFYRYWQPVYEIFITRLGALKIEFIQGISSDVISEVVDRPGGKRKLLIFDDSCEEILQSVEFVNLATAGRHKGLHVIFVKHNLFQQGKYSVTVDKNTTHIILMKSPRIGQQLQILGRQIDGANSKFLHECYKKATAVKYGHLLLDLSPNSSDLMRFCSDITGSTNNGAFSTFWLPPSMLSGLQEVENDETTSSIYAQAL